MGVPAIHVRPVIPADSAHTVEDLPEAALGDAPELAAVLEVDARHHLALAEEMFDHHPAGPT